MEGQLTFNLTLGVGAEDGRFDDPNDADYEYQVIRFKKGRLQQSLGTSSETANNIRTQVDDIVWRALTSKYAQMPVDQIAALDAFITANFKP
jgi:hypothetical protein